MSPPPPPLVDDLIPEILVHLPPDDPACLVRASVVCKPWRRLLTDPNFLRRYRTLHPTPPMLGFLRYMSGRVSRFVPTSSFRPTSPDHRNSYAIDARHGRVLFKTIPDKDLLVLDLLVVWDPITDQQWRMPPVPVSSTCFNAAVLCAAVGCDHLDCHDGPFRVAYMGMNQDGISFACLYSSEAGEWSEPTEFEHLAMLDYQHSVLVGNILYFACMPHIMSEILEYDIGSGVVSLIDPPLPHPLPHQHQSSTVLMTTEDGELGFACVHKSRLYLWSREAGPNQAVAWMQRKVIELETMLPTCALPTTCRVIGFADGLSIIFLMTNAGVFSIELKSGHVRKVSFPGRFHYYIHYYHPNRTNVLIPYMSFYTPDRATRRFPPP